MSRNSYSPVNEDDPERLTLGRDKRFLRDDVYRVLRRWILDQRLAWGQELIETALAERLGVSRTPIRESIRQLEADGLVERHPSGGVRVRRFSARDIREIYEVLMPLFEMSAVLAAEHYDPTAGPQIEADLRLAGATDDIQRMISMRDNFHNLLLELAGNDWLTRTLSQLREYTAPYRRVLLANEDYRRETLDQMWEIFVAIRDRRPEIAGALMRAHIVDFRDKVLEAMSNSTPGQLDSVNSGGSAHDRHPDEAIARA